MATIEELTETIVKFRDERDWAQFHNAKDLSLALSIEAAELNQLFLTHYSLLINIILMSPKSYWIK